MPLTGAAFLMVTLAVTGSPPFSFFQSEFTVLQAGFARELFCAGDFFRLLSRADFFRLPSCTSPAWFSARTRAFPAADMCRWKEYSVAVLAVVIVVMGLSGYRLRCLG